jgi:hypothetical protein
MDRESTNIEAAAYLAREDAGPFEPESPTVAELEQDDREHRASLANGRRYTAAGLAEIADEYGLHWTPGLTA